ncbi:MAG: hypothetical protein ABWZ98_05925 [Nakamurella sp.]
MSHPRRNRVTPHGDIVATPLRGAWMGNRGSLHRGFEIVRYSRNRAWITCALQYKDWSVPQWAPGRYTPLFFHDEAVSFAAGHRPCALCRRAAYQDYRAASSPANGDIPLKATDLDRQLHHERLIDGTDRRRLHPMDWASLPAGVFAVLDGQPCLVLTTAVVPWTIDGYLGPLPRPGSGTAQVLTPPTSIRALAAGYPVQIGLGPAGGASQLA